MIKKYFELIAKYLLLCLHCEFEVSVSFYLNKSDHLKRNGLLLRNIKILLVQLSSVIKKLCIYWLFVSYVMAESLHALPSIYYWVKCVSGNTDVNFL